MSLKIHLLGQFKIQSKDQRVELPSRPAQSLLAYLALNAGVTQRREKLASLLWPETRESNARSYLRQALWRIRKALESASLNPDDYLQISDISITFNAQSDYWLDAEHLLEQNDGHPVEELVETVRLYRGELLPGFYDEWVVIERERLQTAYQQKMNTLLDRLIQDKQWEDALKWGEEWIRLGYSPEPAYRGMMSAYAGMGDQGMVSATYRRCVEAMERELGLEPSPETRKLYEQILDRELSEVKSAPPPDIEIVSRRPTFLDEEPMLVDRPVFVARDDELAQLDGYLQRVLAGQGRVVFVTGEVGCGKTALIDEFTRRAQESHADLVVASGNCNAHTGVGDPYLPFREILEQLTGDVEARFVAGAISGEHARRLWSILPYAARALMEVGPDLIGAFIPGSPLAERVSASAPGGAEWMARLDDLVGSSLTTSIVRRPQQSDIFKQYSNILQSLASQAPLVLVVDDLQWADLGSINLLFHLGRSLGSHPILLLGAFRSEEIAIGRDAGRHPLDSVINELKRQFGEIMVVLGKSEDREFVESLLDSEPNQLGLPFREMLYRQTHGHPLFTIELLRGLQDRGDLVKDQDGQWIENTELEWESLPARVEAVIEERINRIGQPLREALRVASVEGESFTAEVVAKVLASDEREQLVRMSDELDRRHRIVRAESIQRIDGQLLSCYRFRHILFQKYLYSILDEVERVHLHEQVGNALEELYGVQEAASQIPVQLARHFQEARITEKAIYYLHQAGDKAVQLSAYQEGIKHLDKGLELLEALPDSPQRAEKELALQISLGMAWMGQIPYPEYMNAHVRARELCQQTGNMSHMGRILSDLAIFHYVRAEHQQARELTDEALSITTQAGDSLAAAISHWHMGVILFALGEFTASREHLKQTISFYEPRQHHHEMVFLRGSDAGVSAIAYDACNLWCLGYPDQALRLSQEALTLARKLGHPFSLADVLGFAGCMFQLLHRNGQMVLEAADALIQLSVEKSFASWYGAGCQHRGEALVLLGEYEQGISQIRHGMDSFGSIDAHVNQTITFGLFAEAQAKLGRIVDGLKSLDEALDLVEHTDERHWEAELHRIKGEIMLMQADDGKAEVSFLKAIQVAQRQRAKSWELRATIDLARLWHRQGRVDDALAILGKIYNWFTEGFDTNDLVEARALLEEMT